MGHPVRLMEHMPVARAELLRLLGATRGTGSWSGCGGRRSEEHTSELQSLRHLVCRLLLEKRTFFNDTATTEIYTLSLHDALPIWLQGQNCSAYLARQEVQVAGQDVEAGKIGPDEDFGWNSELDGVDFIQSEDVVIERRQG